MFIVIHYNAKWDFIKTWLKWSSIWAAAHIKIKKTWNYENYSILGLRKLHIHIYLSVKYCPFLAINVPSSFTTFNEIKICLNFWKAISYELVYVFNSYPHALRLQKCFRVPVKFIYTLRNFLKTYEKNFPEISGR